jgi:hypothetical protein
MINPILGGQSRKGAVAGLSTRRLCPSDPRRTQVTETPEKESQAETLNKETQLDKESVALNMRSRRMPAIVVSSLALAVVGAVAIYALPKFNIALPNFSS